MLVSLLLISGCAHNSATNSASTPSVSTRPVEPEGKQLEELEHTFDGKIGVYAINTSNGEIIAHREDERFPLQSTIKFMGVAALLKQSDTDSHLLQEIVHYSQNDLIEWSPITRKNITGGMTLEALSEAAISYSDNAAINIIMKRLGGPPAVAQFAHSVGNQTYNVEHYDGALNSDPTSGADTSTPRDMAASVQKLSLGDGLTPAQQTQLLGWMRNNTAGYRRIRAGVPGGWVVADKTGSGDYGIANDIGILWSPYCKPIVLAIYTVQNQRDAKRREDIVASATSIVLDQFAKKDHCFEELSSS
ncbi:class A beta-lactamase [Mycobacterium attenuatum]|uniref:class A beta-lactamase n=1 Tax=Mycobacterium attenuatum TaxID=2341086 RepID=UPI00145A02FD|nr:class A beta-lactamase [Mycobacterium attenuatum]